ncbi:glycosyltransferase family 9 protein, partial [Klebsiella quasipneumoniae]|uniref:glycosyltransferase family 9 protein n=1 Tax=Klebsiella quasipneumoniae TaxID=1463165 RepID=UPI002730F6D8
DREAAHRSSKRWTDRRCKACAPLTDLPTHSALIGAEFGESKRWPSEHYAKVAEAKIREGWQVWLFGSKKDHPVGEDIRQRLIPGLREEAVNLSGDTSLAEAIDLL